MTDPVGLPSFLANMNCDGVKEATVLYGVHGAVFRPDFTDHTEVVHLRALSLRHALGLA